MEALGQIRGYLLTEGIIETERVIGTLIRRYSFVDQNGEETVLHPKLGFFEEVILVLREELPYQWAGGFTKVRKMWERFKVAVTLWLVSTCLLDLSLFRRRPFSHRAAPPIAPFNIPISMPSPISRQSTAAPIPPVIAPVAAPFNEPNPISHNHLSYSINPEGLRFDSNSR